MTKQEAERIFNTMVLPEVVRQYESDGVKDYPARSFEWSSFTDNLCRDGEITLKQYETWVYPKSCNRRKK